MLKLDNFCESRKDFRYCLVSCLVFAFLCYPMELSVSKGEM